MDNLISITIHAELEDLL